MEVNIILIFMSKIYKRLSACKGAMAFMLIGFSAVTGSAQVMVNEIMQSNVRTVFVDDDYPDSWVELYNPSESALSLAGWGLGVKEKFASAYILPEGTEIPAGGYLTVWCDKSDIGGLHADFRVDSSKGSVYLFDASGAIVETVTLKKMIAPDIAYGRIADGADEWAYFVAATPGAPNKGATAADAVPLPLFSEEGGVRSGSFTLTVSIPEGAPADARLGVTTDGTLPKAPATAQTSVTLTIDKSTPVTVQIFSDEALILPPTTHTYLFLDRPTDLPIVCLTVDPADLYDPDKGILFGSENDPDPNFLQNWRRPLNVEYFDKASHARTIGQLAEMRVQGGTTRTYNQKSFIVYANKRFGTKRIDSSDFWESKPEVKESKSIILRNSGNDFFDAHIRDAYVQTMLGTGFGTPDYQAYTPALTFINGSYSGLRDIRERTDEDFVEANYDGLEDLDMFENFEEYKEGDENAINELLSYTASADATFDGLSEIFDTHNLMSILAMSVYSCHVDYMYNNVVVWRPTIGDDQRWRFIAKDFDISLGRYSYNPEYNYFDWIRTRTENENSYIRRLNSIFRLATTDPAAQKRLREYLLFMLGDFMQTDNASAIFLDMEKAIADEVRPTFGTYYDPGTADLFYSYWQTASAPDGNIGRWLNDRPAHLLAQMREEWKLGAQFPLSINPEGEQTSLYGLAMTQPQFEGWGFNGVPVTLSGAEGKCWRIETRLADGSLLTPAYMAELDNYIFPEGTAAASLRLVDAAAVEGVDADSAPSEWFSIQGISLGSTRPTLPGIYIERRGTTSVKTIIP